MHLGRYRCHSGLSSLIVQIKFCVFFFHYIDVFVFTGGVFDFHSPPHPSACCFPFLCEKNMNKKNRGGGQLCEFFEGYSANGSDAAMPDGIYSLDDLKEFGREKG